MINILGNWNAQTNTPTLINGTGNSGDAYVISVSGTRNLGQGIISYQAGNLLVYTDTGIWDYLGPEFHNTGVTVPEPSFAGGTVTEVDMVVPEWYNISGNPITTKGTLEVKPNPNLPPKQFLATPTTGSGPISPRSITMGDLPQSIIDFMSSPTVGTVYQINTGTGLIGGPITHNGTISLNNTTVIPGTYSQATITVDAQGRITNASNGGVADGTVTSVSIVSANGFSGTVATATTTPAITLTTTITGILKGNGTAISAAISGTDYEVPLTFSTGLTRTSNTITVNTTQNITTLSNLTTNGIVYTTGGIGTLNSGNLSGDVTTSGLVASISNTTVTGKLLTGYVSGAGTILATDSILQAIQKLNGNIGALTTGVSSVFGRTGAVIAQGGDYNTSQVTESGNLYFTNARAIGSTLTGYISGSGTITSSDSLLTAIQKLNGNIGALVTGVSSVSNSDSSLTISPTTGAVVAAINAGHNVNWSVDQTINTLTIGLGGSSTTTNTAIGVLALANNTTGVQSTAVGYQALRKQTTAGTNDNTGVGYQAGKEITTGYNNTAIGTLAMYLTGSGVLDNTAIGHGTLGQTTGNYNTGLGFSVLNNASMSGANNIALGYATGQGITTGSQNIIIGQYNGTVVGGRSITTGNYNVILGGYDIPNLSNHISLSDGQGNIGILYDASGGNPAANLLFGWDNTDGKNKYITLGTGLSYDHSTHTLNSTGSGGTVTSVSGTTNRITSTGGTTPVIDISASYVGQASITTLGTITQGVWNASPIVETFGGTNQITYTTGDILYASATNTLSKLAGNITSTRNFLVQTGTGSISAAPSWATILASDIPTLNQNTTGSAASLSISGQTGLLTFTGLTSTNRAKTVRDAADTILELGGSYTPTGTWTSLTMVTPVLGTPTSGTLTNCTGLPISTGVSGLGTGVATMLATFSSANIASACTDETGSGALMFGTDPALTVSSPTATSVGYLGIPQVIKNSSATTVMTDSGKHWYHSDSSAYTWTIAANGSVAYPIGTTLTFINNGSGTITIAITTDTLQFGSSTGSRTLAQYGLATAVKVASTVWFISGNAQLT